MPSASLIRETCKVYKKHTKNYVSFWLHTTDWHINRYNFTLNRRHDTISTFHYNGVIMDAIASKITSLTIIYSTVYSGADQRKHQSSASLAFVWGIHRRPVNSPHKWPVTRNMFPFDDVIMLCLLQQKCAALCYPHFNMGAGGPQIPLNMVDGRKALATSDTQCHPRTTGSNTSSVKLMARGARRRIVLWAVSYVNRNLKIIKFGANCVFWINGRTQKCPHISLDIKCALIWLQWNN